MNTTILLKANLLAATTAATPARPQTTPKPPKQTPAQLREYRRVLRAAEQAAWDAAEPRPEASSLPSPVMEPDRPATLLFALIALASLMALVFGAESVANFGTHWNRFVEFIRFAVS